MLSQPTERKLAIGFIVVFLIATAPPVIFLVDAPVAVFGINQLYLWTVVWALFISFVLLWAAWRDVFALTEEQVPPELRDEDVMTEQSSAVDDTTAGGSE